MKYNLRIVLYNQSRYYQFIPEDIYDYISEIPMWKFLKNIVDDGSLERKCFIFRKSSVVN
jgi:hypothetical protein